MGDHFNNLSTKIEFIHRRRFRGLVSYSDGITMGKKISAARYMEASALIGEGVDEAFEVPLFAFLID